MEGDSPAPVLSFAGWVTILVQISALAEPAATFGVLECRVELSPFMPHQRGFRCLPRYVTWVCRQIRPTALLLEPWWLRWLVPPLGVACVVAPNCLECLSPVTDGGILTDSR